MQVAILALISLIGLQQGDAWSLRDKSHAADFDAINDMLVKMVPSDDIEANMALIKETYKTKVEEKRNAMVKALEKLVALETIVSSKECNRNAYELLTSLNLGTHSKALTYAPIRRLDRIVRHYAIEHSRLCYSLYPKLVETRMAEVDPKHREYVKLLEDSDILMIVLEIWNTQYGRNEAEDCSMIGVYWEPEQLKSLNPYKAIDASTEAAAATGDEQGRSDLRYLAEINKLACNLRIVDVARVEKMVDRYIYNPCVEVNEKVAEELLDPIRFGLTVQRKTGTTEQCADTIHDRVILGYCRELVRDKKFKQVLIQRMIYDIENRP